MSDTNEIIRIPIGEMSFMDDGCLKIKLSKEHSQPVHMRIQLQALKRLDIGHFWIPDSDKMEMRDGRLCLYYPQVNNRLVPFSTAAESWQKNPQIRIPFFISLAKFLVECSRELHQIGVTVLPPSPLTLFYISNSDSPWRLVVLPLSDNKISDWSQADPLNWQWISPETLFEGKFPDECFLCGSILHYCLVGDLFPVLLNKQEKLERVMKARRGRLADLNRSFRAALPSTLGEEGEKFAHIIGHLLEPGHAVHSDHDQPHNFLEELEKKFSLNRLASRWEYEGKLDVALDLLLTYVDFAGPARVPWNMIARLRELKGDWKDSLEARLKALNFGEDDSARDAIHYLLRLAHLVRSAEIEDTEGYTFFHEAFYRVEATLYENIDEVHILQMAHLAARYFRKNEKVLQSLNKNFRDPWNQLLRLMIIARTLCLQKEYPSVSKLCKEGIRIIDKLPDQGLNEGRYVLSYLQIIDGIAHFGAVGRLDDTSYFIDSFARFTGGLDVAMGIGADDLINNGTQWLLFLANHADHFPAKIYRTLKTGISAYFATKKKIGFEIPITFERIPTIPWYDENLLFPS